MPENTVRVSEPRSRVSLSSLSARGPPRLRRCRDAQIDRLKLIEGEGSGAAFDARRPGRGAAAAAAASFEQRIQLLRIHRVISAGRD